MKLIQITDIHLVPRGKELHGLNPYERLDACIADINANHGDADLCIVTGDLVHNGAIEAYEDLRDCLLTLRVPYHLLLGNHDHREIFRRVFPNVPCDENGFVQSVIDTAAGRFLLLDTVEHGCAWGSYCEQRGAWLQSQLEASRDRPVYLFMHHPPFDIGIPCLDRIRLLDGADRIREIIEPHENIRHLFLGHVHRPVTGSWQGLPFSMMRGINHQVAFDFGAFEVVPKSHEPPAYAVIFPEAGQTVVHFHDYLDDSLYPYNPLGR